MADNTVKSVNAQYGFYSSIWAKNNAFVTGSKAVKDGGELYLPNPNKNINDPYRAQEYAYYKESAPFLALASYSHKALSGAINRKPIDTTDLNPQLEYLIDNADGDGLGLNQLVAQCVDEVVKNARVGLLTELPVTNGAELSLADNANGARPYIKIYNASSIINWDDDTGGQKMINLQELVKENPEALFGSDMELQYRVLLNDGGSYVQRLYNDANSNETYEEIPVTFNGQSFKYIPFNFIGSKNNDSDCDDSILAPIVELNQTHYINSALDQNITNQCSFIGTFISSSMDDDEVTKTFPNGLNMGSSLVTFLPENSQVITVQAEPNNSAREKCLQSVNDAVSIGAKIIMEGGTNTATEAIIDSVAETATLAQIAINVERAINDQLANISMVLGVSQESKIIVNKETGFTGMSAQERQVWMQDVELGNIPKSDYYDALRRAGLIDEDRTNEELISESDTGEISNA